ncbi:diguanylate cyclase domain-containing protein [Deinococcus arcticus]|uniref:diguanylate cyclase domain-containing protein n=1 Tax=Deinococcus arcticus TaxID=2136176 RepID=UPI001304C14B|nr:GGDEF domain-containing protein [Deinococcus arcticus]
MQLERLRGESEHQRRQRRALLEDHDILRHDRQALARQASHDPLTGLPNRAHFRAQGEALLAQPDGAECAVVFVDLDGFKPVNDAHGHAGPVTPSWWHASCWTRSRGPIRCQGPGKR